MSRVTGCLFFSLISLLFKIQLLHLSNDSPVLAMLVGVSGMGQRVACFCTLVLFKFWVSLFFYTKTADGNAASKQPASLKPMRSQGQNPDKAIPFTLSNYLELVDWTGRVVRKDKRGSISVDTPPILERLRIDPDEWLKTMSWNNRFRRAVGKLASLKAYAAETGKKWVHGVSCSQSLYLQ